MCLPLAPAHRLLRTELQLAGVSSAALYVQLAILYHSRYFKLHICPNEQVEILFINVLLRVNIDIRHAQDTTIRTF